MSINTKNAEPGNGQVEGCVNPNRREEILRAYPWLERMFVGKRPCKIKILMVADGALDFGKGAFGLDELISKALKPSSMPWANICITTAHRDNENGQVADIKNFKFDVVPLEPYNVPFNIEHYNQVWLFGFYGQKPKIKERLLSKSELKVLSDFMEAGGGVFATGDHQDLGFALCGQVPRVRSMRKWFFPEDGPNGEPVAPDLDGHTRIDTLREGLDIGFQSSDQSDVVPQEIRPRLSIDPKTGKGSCPHPLLAYQDSAVKVLPDHMHEGECIVPTKEKDLERTFSFDDAGKPKDEYPPLPNSTVRLPPMPIAIATSAGGYLTDKAGVLPVEPRCFAIITAYDGHLADRLEDGQRLGGVGRVVVDTSFHHFVNLNLNGTGSTNPANKGLYDGLGNPTKDYEAIKHYYQNIVSWLYPAKSRLGRAANLLVALRYMSPLVEEIRPIENPTLKDLLWAGAVTHNAISELFSAAEATQYMLDLVEVLPNEMRDKLRVYIDPWLPPSLRDENSFVLFHSEMFVKAVFGGATLEIAKHLPEDGYEAARWVNERKLQRTDFKDMVKNGTNLGVAALFEIVNESRNVLGELSATFNALNRKSMESGSRDAEHDMSPDSRDVFARPGKSFTEEDAMAFKVQGKWETTKPATENIHVGRENAFGGFVGWHERFGVPLKGTHTVRGSQEFIDLNGEVIETDGSTTTFQYKGEIIPDPQDPTNRIIIKPGTGEYHKRDLVRALSEDGDWTAQKPIT
jgi:hypothetical protein